ncbi:hypothetical protein HELRODRAFT_102273 [Helobdella robusta]|uniref:Uncharacterized protein n=1 Tax=Helobdella robusta TaxID=6412 RepID=T1ED91_HELRO|nr:hypothetical protein HELRODRAFT_102273 [Helobdella robusta]ESN97115.1 hypothetical protein HELRODRAFT_102273 [Helobdella robusta]
MTDTFKFVLPGEKICKFNDRLNLLEGVYVKDNVVRSSLAGRLVIEEVEDEDEDGNDDCDMEKIKTIKKIIRVSSAKHGNFVPFIGALVSARVTRVTQRYCKCRITTVEKTKCREPFNGLLRKEDVRDKERDKTDMFKCFRPGDYILARVISTNDTMHYLLSTAEGELGVVCAISEAGSLLVPLSWTEMQCSSTNQKEHRKVARVQPQLLLVD